MMHRNNILINKKYSFINWNHYKLNMAEYKADMFILNNNKFVDRFKHKMISINYCFGCTLSMWLHLNMFSNYLYIINTILN